MKYLFEVSWEVCNLVGGIYTVLRSKAEEAVRAFGDNYFLLGPIRENNTDFVETDEEFFGKMRPHLEKRGLRFKLGRWEIDGRPRVILVDFQGHHNPEKILFSYWQQFGVDSMGSGWDYIEPVLFSTVCGEVIQAIHDEVLSENDTAVAHFHEWMCGGGLLHLKKTTPEIGTVFTTHATILGRAMAGAGVDIYSRNTGIDPLKDSKKFGVAAKWSMEAVCAREADVFTTVSQVTADEAEKFLLKRPSFAVFNGINAASMGSFEDVRARAAVTRNATLELAGKFLGRRLPDDTQLWVTSGRYEYHNKGFDIFVEALAGLNQHLRRKQDAKPVVAWFLIATGNYGLKKDFTKRLAQDNWEHLGSLGIATHQVHNEAGDPILQACQRLGLNNSVDDKVYVIFTPAYITEDDDLFGRNYYDVLASFDLGVFPSYYEPWGYTPLESIAVGVPTITSSLAGFGRWVKETGTEIGKSVIVIERGERSSNVRSDLLDQLRFFSVLDRNQLDTLRAEAHRVAAMAEWRSFFSNYQNAYTAAEGMAYKRMNSLDSSAFSDELFISFKGTEGPGPHYKRLTVVPVIPNALKRLPDLAYNLWWTWHPDSTALFEEIDPELWEDVSGNPILFLKRVSPALLEEIVDDKPYMAKYERVMDEFDDYMQSEGRDYDNNEYITEQKPIAYFSMEFCLHECLPIYSGGLGVLAGDHLKSASDLGIPLIGVGFLYKQGYFQQAIDLDGNQIEVYPTLDPSKLPVEPLKTSDNQDVTITIDLPERRVLAKVWKVAVGKVPLYLLDTDVPENIPADRRISGQLYGGDKQMRIEQEIVLGMGGVKFIEDELQITPALYHLNEGHCSFLLFERIHRLMQKNLSFQQAREAVKAASVFTTHTPVPAGNEAFSATLMRQYFARYAEEKLSISFNHLMEMGLSKAGDTNSPFSMTVLALKLSSRANGVSKLHGKVCQDMWQHVWKNVAIEEVPIISVTNGIHLTSWMGTNIKHLLERYLEIVWDTNQDNPDIWLGIDRVPSELLWFEHNQQKKRLLDILKYKLFRDLTRRGESPRFINESISALNPDALTIGFARRFATYKRATLLFRQRDRLVELLNDPEHPVQIIFAGKAHPADVLGKELIKTIVQESRSEEFRGKIFYLENYDVWLGRILTQGVDVWLNTPIRPHEASGTSGMKVVPNGGLNCSILDGWWDEAYDPSSGFAIKSVVMSSSDYARLDEMDNNALFKLLKEEILPAYFNVDKAGVPTKWILMMKEGLKKFAPMFSTMRMVDEYYRRLYLPTAIRSATLREQDCAGILELTEWKRKIEARFSTVQIEHVRMQGIDGNTINATTPLQIEMVVNPGKMRPDELQAELFIGPDEDDEGIEEMKTVRFEQVETISGAWLKFRLTYQLESSGTFRYTVRVVPTHPLLSCVQETGLVNWA